MTRGANLNARLLTGAIAGIAGTVAMTAVMRRLHRRLPPAERYPLPPREIAERLVPNAAEDTTENLATLSHAAFGAAAGAAMSGAGVRGPFAGSVGGVLVWAASYFGWVPAAGILRPASEHPPRRNLLMIVAHLVWGSVTAISARELLAARNTMLGAGPLRDAPADRD